MQLEFRYRFEAAHRFLSSSSIPCMTPHGHSWYATMVVEFTEAQLNDSQMSVEFSDVKKQWKQLIDGTFDHSYMHNVADPVAELLQAQEASPRLIPFPGDPTTEMISLFMFHKMDLILNASEFSEKLQVSQIILQETPTNQITCHRQFYEKAILPFKNVKGWWSNTDVTDRSQPKYG